MRMWSVGAFFVGVAIAFGGVFFVPSYMLLHSHIGTVTQETDSLEGRATTAREAKALVKKTNLFATELTQGLHNYTFSEIITAIQSVQGDGVELESFTASRDETGAIGEIKVRGSAVSREDLTAFKKNIEAQSMFGTAEVPIEDFVKGSDLPFTITISVTSQNHD